MWIEGMFGRKCQQRNLVIMGSCKLFCRHTFGLVIIHLVSKYN